MQRMTTEQLEQKRVYNRERMRRLRSEHPEQCRASLRRWRAKNPERQRAYRKHAYDKRQALLREAKSGPCVDCGGRFPPQVMDFHHREAKLFDISKVSNRALATFKAEIAKCDLLCANCHRERHPLV